MADTNITKKQRTEMIEFLYKIKAEKNDDETLRMVNKIENTLIGKKLGLVFEEHREEVDDLLQTNIPVLCEDATRRICKDKDLPWNFIIEGDNLMALYLLLKTHKGKINVIYIDPPYNTGARDWKYNNDYVDGNDDYRHSKWLSMMKVRLELAKQLLNPENSTLICTIDEKEYLHLGCLLEEMFPEASIQMVSTVINVKGTARDSEFSRVNEYIFIVRIGKSSVNRIKLHPERLGNIKSSGKNKLRLAGLMRTGSGSGRNDSPGCFYPIIFNSDGKFLRVGEAISPGVDRNTVKVKKGEIAIWPIHTDGSEGRWMYRPSGLQGIISQGLVFFGKLKNGKIGISYAPKGVQEKIKSGEFKIIGYDEDGAAIIDDTEYEAAYIPGNQWAISSHNATEYGTKLLQEIIGEDRFTYPKSIYEVYDTLKFFVADNKDAIILDFFAGSGTTMHAVNLLNAEDGGNRKCIMVTNNEVWAAKEDELKALGYKKGDEEREKRGIAKYVTRPRMECSIKGVNVKGKRLEGDYGFETEMYVPDEDNILVSKKSGKPIKKKPFKKEKLQLYPSLSQIKKSDGFNTNLKYFKCDKTPRKPDEYFLSNILMLHIKEMIELENAIEIDNVKNVLILNKDDYKKYIENDEIYKNIENVRVNQRMILDPDEIDKLNKKYYKNIPEEYFGQELKDVAE